MNEMTVLTRARTPVSSLVRRAGVALLALAAGSMVLPPTSVASVPLVLSTRVGDLIDDVERDRFGLFPQIAGFKCAHVMGEVDGTVTLVISREALADTLMPLSTTEAAHLSRYIDDHERIMRGRGACQYDVIGHLVRGGVIVRCGTRPAIVQVDGRPVMGRIVCLTDSCLVLWTDGASFNSERLADGAVVIPAHRIGTVEVPPPPQRSGRRTGRGALIGGITGLTAGFIAAAASKPQKTGDTLLDSYGQAVNNAGAALAWISTLVL